MTELYIFSQDDDLLTVLSDNELTDAPIKDLLNNVSNEPFVFTVYADAEKAKYVTERNRVVVKDREGDFREFVIDELDDINDKDGPETTATCLPAWQFELQKNFVEDRRFTDRTAQFALDAALEGTRFIGEVEVELGEASTNFYRLASSDCIWKIMDVWGGEFKDTIVLNEKGRISQRKIQLSQRRGADIGARFEIDHNMNSIERTVISDPITAMYGWGASLETEGGGHTRYIDFKDIEWKVSNGDPVDKPKGQAWVGDPDALQKYGLEHNGELLHLYDEFSNQDYEDPEELLMATWEHLQKVKDPEINYKMSVDLLDKPVSLGDTAQGIDRQFSRPIEVQARIIGIEYDILEPDDPAIVEMGHFLSLNDDIIGRELDEIKENLNKTRPTKPIDENSFPDIKPDIPLNVEAVGLFETIKISWDYDFHVYVSHYEVYGSQVADFVPDTQHLLWRGDVSSFGHEVNPDETWYYYVRALNTRGTPSDWSGRVSASSRRIITDDILFGEIKAEHLADGLDLANKISQGTVDFINEGPLLEIQRKEDEILSEVSRRIGDLLNDIDSLEGQIISVEQTVNTELGVISDSIVSIEGGLEDAIADISQFNQRADSIDLSVGRIEGNLENWGVGNINLFSLESLDYGPFIATQYVPTKLPKEATKLTYRRHGDLTDFLVVNYYRDSNMEDRIGTGTEITSSTISTIIDIPSGANYVGFSVIGPDAVEEYIINAKIKFEAGEESTAYSLAPQDVSGVSRSLSFINISKDGLRLHGDKVHITGQTLMEDAVIGTAAIADLAVSRAKLQRAVIGEAQIDSLAVTNAKIGYLAVDSQNVNYSAIVDAHIANLHVDKLTGSIATFIQTGFNNVSHEVEITGAGLSTYSGGNRTSLLNGYGHTFYRNSQEVGYIGTAAWINDPNYRGLLFSLDNKADYMTWAFYETASASNPTTMLSWHKTSVKDRSGFVFSDRVSIDYPNDLQVGAFRTPGSSSRVIALTNYTLSGTDGVGIMRYDDARGGGLFMSSQQASLVAPRSDQYATMLRVRGGTVRTIESSDTYSKTSSNTNNLLRISSGGLFYRSTSSRRYKLLEKAVSDDYAYRILELDAKTWYDKRSVESYSDFLNTGDSEKEEDAETLSRVGGLIAEDVHNVGLKTYVTYDEYGRPDGIASYLWTLLIPVVRDLKLETEDNFDLLKMKNEYLSNKVTHLEHRVENLEKLLEVA